MAAGKIDWDIYATLSGIAQQEASYQRGGKVASGTLREMVQQAKDYEAKGYIGLMILTDGPSYQGNQIVELRNLSSL